MSNKNELRTAIYKKLINMGYAPNTGATRNAMRAYFIVLKNKMEADYSVGFYSGRKKDIPDNMFEDAMGWLNQLLPY